MWRRSSRSMSRPSSVWVWPCRRSRISSVMRCWVSKTVRRRVSVGCAVITGDTSAPVSASATVGRIQLRRVEFQVGGGQAAVLRRLAGRDVHGAAPLAVDVLGDVGQQREMRERADDGDGLMDVDAVEHARPARRGRSRTGGPGTTPRGPARRGRTPPRRSARGPCRRGWRRAAGCPRASVRSPRAPPGCGAPNRSAPARCRSPQPCPKYRRSRRAPHGEEPLAADGAGVVPCHFTSATLADHRHQLQIPCHCVASRRPRSSRRRLALAPGGAG